MILQIQKCPSGVPEHFSGLTLGGGSTYGIAGDSVKYGFTYLVWLPISLFTGMVADGHHFSRRYYRSKGLTVNVLLKKIDLAKRHIWQ